MPSLGAESRHGDKANRAAEGHKTLSADEPCARMLAALSAPRWEASATEDSFEVSAGFASLCLLVFLFDHVRSFSPYHMR